MVKYEKTCYNKTDYYFRDDEYNKIEDRKIKTGKAAQVFAGLYKGA